jgi:beta-barrel assembly-enhancing protease
MTMERDMWFSQYPKRCAAIVPLITTSPLLTPMCRISLLLLIAAFPALTCSVSQAAGSFQTKPAFPGVVTADAAPAVSPVPEPVSDNETELGLAIYNELKTKGEIIAASPLYDSLGPVVEPITKIAQARYEHPFKFFLVHEPGPNAFSVPGGNVYVTDSLMYFVKNREELAGTLCHEVAHTIHHDAMTKAQESQMILGRQIGAAILLGPTLAQAIAISMLGDLHSQAYSRDIETAADLTGSDICAAAGINPWGLVWLFQDFENADPKQMPEFLSDHPGNETRVNALEKHFRENPALFSKFNRDRTSATPFSVPEDAPIRFLR